MKPEIIAKVSERLAYALKCRNMRQIELCKATGIDRGSLSSYIKGRYEPKDDKIILMAQALSVDPAWLCGFDVPMVKGMTPPATTDGVNAKYKELVAILEQLPDELLPELIRYAEFLKSKHNP